MKRGKHLACLRISSLAVWILGAMFGAIPVGAASAASPPGLVPWPQPVSTYSIVAIDPEANQMGVAVQSCYFVVGPTVIWVEPGVGVIATQAYVDVGYGPRGLALMRNGKTAKEALEALLHVDPDRDVRQVAMIDVHGNVAAHTGSKATPAAGHVTGKNYSAQGNLLANDRVWPAMAHAFETTQGPLAERLMAALEAAEATGGDLRCSQSAAMKIVRIKPQGPKWQNVVLDLRVDDHPDPIRELRRLLNIRKGMQMLGQSFRLLQQGNLQGAQEAFERATKLAPDKVEWRFWHGLRLVLSGHVEAGIEVLRDLAKRGPQWLTLWERIQGTGRFNIDPEIWKRVRDAMAAVSPKKP